MNEELLEQENGLVETADKKGFVKMIIIGGGVLAATLVTVFAIKKIKAKKAAKPVEENSTQDSEEVE